MSVTNYEGDVENGKIRLKAGVKLPENAKVYVIVTDLKTENKKNVVQVLSPHLIRRGDAVHFEMKISSEKPE